jgi:hypothetical protein
MVKPSGKSPQGVFYLFGSVVPADDGLKEALIHLKPSDRTPLSLGRREDQGAKFTVFRKNKSHH